MGEYWSCEAPDSSANTHHLIKFKLAGYKRRNSEINCNKNCCYFLKKAINFVLKCMF